MIVLPITKLGTIPFGPAEVAYKRKYPVVGERIRIRPAGKGTGRSNPWIWGIVDHIKGDNEIWFISKS